MTRGGRLVLPADRGTGAKDQGVDHRCSAGAWNNWRGGDRSAIGIGLDGPARGTDAHREKGIDRRPPLKKASGDVRDTSWFTGCIGDSGGTSHARPARGDFLETPLWGILGLHRGIQGGMAAGLVTQEPRPAADYAAVFLP